MKLTTADFIRDVFDKKYQINKNMSFRESKKNLSQLGDDTLVELKDKERSARWVTKFP